MKRVALVGKNGVAVVVNEENEVLVQATGADSIEALLRATKEFLLTIPTNNDEKMLDADAVTVYIPNKIRGLASGSVMSYIRTAKTSRGNDLTAETIQLYKECMELWGERILSVDFKDATYASKNSTEVVRLVNSAWNKVKSLAGNTTVVVSQAPVVNPKIASKIAELEEQIMDAILNDDTDEEVALKAKLEKIKALASGSTVVEQPKQEENKDGSAMNQFNEQMNA